MSALSPSFMTALLATSLLVACAHTPTPYQPRPDGGQYGYSEQGLEPDRIRVVFRGNTLTARETVENYLLYRAAEVTQQRGYAYFSPMQQEVEREEEERYVATGVGFGHPGWYGWGTRFMLIETLPGNSRESFRASAVFKLYKDQEALGEKDAFNAAAVLQEMAALIQRPEPKPEAE